MGGRALRFLPKCSRSPRVRPALDPQLLNSPGALLPPTATFLGRVPRPLPAFPRRPCLDPGRFLSPGPQPLSVSLLPRTPATPSFPNPQISPLGQLLGCPDSLAQPVLGLPESPCPRTRSLRVTSGHPSLWDPSRSRLPKDLSDSYIRAHTQPRSVPQTRAAVRPKGSPGLTRLGPAPPTWPTRTPPPGAGPVSH